MGGMGGGRTGRVHLAHGQGRTWPSPRRAAAMRKGEIAEEKLGEDLAADARGGEGLFERTGRTRACLRGHDRQPDRAGPFASGRRSRCERRRPAQRFVETAYWNPSVVTGKDGKAGVTFRAPAALSEYRFTARGVTGPDTLVGQTTADLAVRKDFFVDLKVPAA